MAVKYSCKGCTERHVGCHAACQKYITEKAENDRLKSLNAKQPRIHLNSNGTLYSGKSPRKKLQRMY